MGACLSCGAGEPHYDQKAFSDIQPKAGHEGATGDHCPTSLCHISAEQVASAWGTQHPSMRVRCLYEPLGV